MKKRKLNDELRLQPDDTSCGPIAIVNAYKHIHQHFPKISVKRIRSICKTNNEYGTFRWNITNTSLIDMSKKPIYDIKKIMNQDKFILLYSFSEYCQHYVYVVQDKKQKIYYIYNYYNQDLEKYEHTSMNSSNFMNLLKNNPRCSHDLDYPLAWNIM